VKRFIPGGGSPNPSPVSPKNIDNGDVEQQKQPTPTASIEKLTTTHKPSPFDSVKRSHRTLGIEYSTPLAMGQTMSAQASKAMVEQLKSNTGNGSRTSAVSATSYTKKFLFMKRPNLFLTEKEKEYNKQKTEFVEEMKKLATLRHQCVITIMGAVLAKEDSMIVLEYMDHGSLYDVLHNETFLLEGEIILPILRDIASGVRFLHAASPQIVHCDLKASNILVDARFRAKVADFGLSTVASDKGGAAGTPYFLAPEILRGETGNTVESDAYAFGMVLYVSLMRSLFLVAIIPRINCWYLLAAWTHFVIFLIVQEVYSRKDPYESEIPLEVLRLVVDKYVNKRPPAPDSMPSKAQTLMTECLNGDPRRRPTFEELDLQLKRLDTSTMEPVGVESSRTKKEQALKNDSLLEDMFPKHVADALREGRNVEPHSSEDCTIFSSEICGFAGIADSLSPVKVADLLHRLYSKFDDLCGEYDIYKVETINDAYMVRLSLVSSYLLHQSLESSIDSELTLFTFLFLDF